MEEEEEGALAQGLIAATVTVGIHTNSPHESFARLCTNTKTPRPTFT